MSDIQAQLLSLYAGEYRDHVAALRELLRCMAEGRSGDLEEGCRHAHSLKGAARVVDLPWVVAIAHRLEAVLQWLWEGMQSCDSDHVALMKRALDAVEDLSATALSGDRPPNVSSISVELDDLIARLGLPPAPAAPAQSPTITERPPPVATNIIRVDPETLDRVGKASLMLQVLIGHNKRLLTDLRQISADIDRLVIRPPKDPIGQLRRLARRHATALGHLEDSDWRLARQAEDLRTDIHVLRLIAADQILGGLARSVRETAEAQGKAVEAVFTGLEVRADRDVLQALLDPVVHALRNAVTHGLEPREERIAAGKDAMGRVFLFLTIDGNRLHLRIEDDGRGLDLPNIAEVAVQRGLWTADKAATARPEEISALILSPGITTATGVDSFAGRGMGMTIIRRSVERLHGAVTIEARAGGGTVLTLAVPITILGQTVVLVSCRERIWALPAGSVIRLALIDSARLNMIEGRQTVVIDGLQVVLADLASVLGFGLAARGNELAVVVLRAGAQLVGAVVDRFVDVCDLPVAMLDEPFSDNPLFIGTVSLGDGSLALVISVSELAARSPGIAQLPEAMPARQPPLIMIVDDSITTRTLEKSILDSHGYRVTTAVDGKQALEMLKQRAVDLVIADIEMPNVDGFDLLRAMKAIPVLAEIPVVLVTARDKEEDRRLGLELGADAYIAKSRFDQGELLAYVERLT